MDEPNAGTSSGPAPANPGVIAADAEAANPLRDPRDRRIPRVAGPSGELDERQKRRQSRQIPTRYFKF